MSPTFAWDWESIRLRFKCLTRKHVLSIVLHLARNVFKYQISYKKTDRYYEYYEWTDRYSEWTDEYCEWPDEYYEWTDECYEWTDRYYEWTDEYCEWTDKYHEWINEYYEWIKEYYEWKNEYYKCEKSTTSGQTSNNIMQSILPWPLTSWS